jgi:hypothetical protein
MPLTTKALTERCSDALAFLTGDGFRYFSSFEHFRRDDPHGHSYITINSVTHNRLDYHLAFYIGVRIDTLESTIKQILGQPTKLTHYDRSITNYTVNIGPNSHGWRYPIPGTWTFREARDIDSQLSEVSIFIRELALPFLDRNTTSATVRQTLLGFPRHTQNLKPFQQILTADILADDASQMEADYSLLTERHAQWHPPLKAEFNQFYLHAKSFLQARNAS